MSSNQLPSPHPCFRGSACWGEGGNILKITLQITLIRCRADCWLPWVPHVEEASERRGPSFLLLFEAQKCPKYAAFPASRCWSPREQSQEPDDELGAFPGEEERAPPRPPAKFRPHQPGAAGLACWPTPPQGSLELTNCADFWSKGSRAWLTLG